MANLRKLCVDPSEKIIAHCPECGWPADVLIFEEHYLTEQDIESGIVYSISLLYGKCFDHLLIQENEFLSLE